MSTAALTASSSETLFGQGRFGPCLGAAALVSLLAFEADPDGFDALISDFNMPGTSGLETAAQALRLRPQLPVALASGLVTDDLLAQAQAVGIREVIYKPHSMDDLAAALHRMLS